MTVDSQGGCGCIGKNKARGAIARRVLTLAYYGPGDGETRCLTPPETASDTSTMASSAIGMTPALCLAGRFTD